MNFDDFKRINKNKQIHWFKIHKPKLIINRASSYLTLAKLSSNTRYKYNDKGKLIVVPVYINNYNLIDRRSIYLKASESISFSELDHYM